MAVETKAGKKTSPREVIERAKAEGVEVVDVRFIDLPGTWQHFSLPLGELEEDSFTGGLGFDGSSIRGFQSIDESDMLLIPDPDSATIDPVLSHKTLFLICDVIDPITREPYSRDARFIAKKAEDYLKRSGIADVSYWGPEAEFYLFSSLRFDQNAHSGYYHIDSDEGIWNSGRNTEPNLAFRPRHKEGYFPVPPTDKLQDLRSEIMLKLIEAGVQVEVQHHEVGTAGQAEIDMRFDTLTKMGDKMMVYKYVIKNVAAQHGYVATFMPKPLFMDNGSGMHVHQSLWKDGENLFADTSGYAGLSQTAIYYIGGLLKHAPALLALCAPTTNSYRRLVPGYEAPINLVYSKRNRSACVRSGRNQAQDPSSRAGRQGHLRARGRGEGEDQVGPRLARRIPGRAREGPCVPHRGRRLHEGCRRDLDRVQAQERGRPGRAATAPMGVHALPRRLISDRSPRGLRVVPGALFCRDHSSTAGDP